MKKNLILLAVLSLSVSVFAFDYVPKNPDANPFGRANSVNKQERQVTEKSVQPEMREIKNLAEYFKYLPKEVHRNWTPYEADRDYEVVVQFVVKRDGSVSDIQIIGSNYPNANRAVIDAVKKGAPYQPLPMSYERNSVKAQVFLEYHAKHSQE